MSTDVRGLRIQRLTQPPAVSWALWSAYQPGAVVTVGLTAEEYRTAREGGPKALGEAVRRRIDEGQDSLRELLDQLADL